MTANGFANETANKTDVAGGFQMYPFDFKRKSIALTNYPTSPATASARLSGSRSFYACSTSRNGRCPWVSRIIERALMLAFKEDLTLTETTTYAGSSIRFWRNMQKTVRH